MTKYILTAAALLLSALPACAQTPAKPLTPPEVLGAAKTIQFTTTFYRNDKPVEVSYATLAQPNKAYVMDVNFNTKVVDTIYVSDGKTQTEYSQSQNHYTKIEVAADFQDIASRTLTFATLADFYDPKSFNKFQHYPGDAPDVLRMPFDKPGGREAFEVLDIDARTRLPKSVSVMTTPSGPPSRPPTKITFSEWKLNVPIDNSRFVYVPPVGATLVVIPKP